MHIGYTIKLYPNTAQAELLDKHFGCARWVYNEMIRINQKRYHRTGKGLSGFDMQSYLPKLKKQYPWLAEVNAQSLQIVCHNLAEAYGRFFKKQSGYPTSKKKFSRDSFTCVDNCRLEGTKIRLPKLGFIPYRGGDQPEGKIKRFTIKKTASGYYASLLIDSPKKPTDNRVVDKILGIDLGLKDIVVTSVGEKIVATKPYISACRSVRKKQKALSRKQKGSHRCGKAKADLAKLHEKIRNQRKDFNHKLSRKLVNSESQAFAIEDLNVKGMMANHCLAKHIADCGWHQFLTFLKYKSAIAGKPVLEVGRFFPSSKTCSTCGIARESMPLSERKWTCDSCGSHHDRDVNAAINIAMEGARNAPRRDGVIPSIIRSVAVDEARM